MRDDLKNILSGLIPNEKVASGDLIHLNLFELEAMLGIGEEEKVANHFTAQEHSEMVGGLRKMREEKKQRAAQGGVLGWLAGHSVKALDQDIKSLVENRDKMIKKAGVVEYTGQVNNGDPKMPTWPRAALGVDSAGRKATPEERKASEGDVATPQHVEPHEDGKDFVAKTSHERRLLEVVKMADLSGLLQGAARKGLTRVADVAAHAPRTTSAGLAEVSRGIAGRAGRAMPPPVPAQAQGIFRAPAVSPFAGTAPGAARAIAPVAPAARGSMQHSSFLARQPGGAEALATNHLMSNPAQTRALAKAHPQGMAGVLADEAAQAKLSALRKKIAASMSTSQIAAHLDKIKKGIKSPRQIASAIRSQVAA